MAISIKERILSPRLKKEFYPLTCRLPVSLVKRVEKIKDKENFSWPQIIEACLIQFCEEMEKGKSK